MSSPEEDLISEPLSPAEETSAEFEEVIVKSEDESDDQPGLLDLSGEGTKTSVANLLSQLNVYINFLIPSPELKPGSSPSYPKISWLSANLTLNVAATKLQLKTPDGLCLNKSY